jgi:hypothetical protein
MKPRKVTLTLEITTDVSIGLLRKTRAVKLYDATPDGPMEPAFFARIAVQQATASVVQPIPNANTAKPKKGASKK